MKSIKKTLLGLGFITIALSSCSKGCDKENPSAYVQNNGNEKVSVQIKTTGGNTENINNIDPGKFSEMKSYAPGEIVYTITVKDQEPVDEKVTMSYCTDYIIKIDNNNKVSTSVIVRE